MSTDSPPTFPTSSCESCHAPIIWAVNRNNDPMPIDTEPVNPNTGGGTVLLTARGGTAPLAAVVSNPAQLFGKRWVWRPHMKTCPYAERYRAVARRPASRGRVRP